MKTKRRKTGDIGEEIASMFLVKHGFEIVERNFLVQCGEIDIIAVKDGVFHFVEVKTFSHETAPTVTHETDSDFRPEDNVTRKKVEKITRTAKTYLCRRFGREDGVGWCLDVVSIGLFLKDKRAVVDFIENIA